MQQPKMERVKWMYDVEKQNTHFQQTSRLRVYLTPIPIKITFFGYKTWLSCNMRLLGHFLTQQSDLSGKRTKCFQNKNEIMLPSMLY